MRGPRVASARGGGQARARRRWLVVCHSVHSCYRSRRQYRCLPLADAAGLLAAQCCRSARRVPARATSLSQRAAVHGSRSWRGRGGASGPWHLGRRRRRYDAHFTRGASVAWPGQWRHVRARERAQARPRIFLSLPLWRVRGECELRGHRGLRVVRYAGARIEHRRSRDLVQWRALRGRHLPLHLPRGAVTARGEPRLWTGVRRTVRRRHALSRRWLARHARDDQWRSFEWRRAAALPG